jgi:hypothetical protein
MAKERPPAIIGPIKGDMIMAPMITAGLLIKSPNVAIWADMITSAM